MSAAIGSHADASDAAPIPHGGDLEAARLLFPDAPQPFVDLSTGINPHAYPLPPFPANVFAQLPQAASLDALADRAAQAYGAPTGAHVVAAPGTQILFSLVVALVKPGRAAVLGPTYAEHARAAALAGHQVAEVAGLDGVRHADLAIVVNPNNPDGRIVSRDDLLACARDCLLLVDEAFIDVAPPQTSLAGDVGRGNIIVLRSFGKFFGLAGLRLGFALTSPALAARLRAALGPWAVGGPALAVGLSALADRAWIAATQARLAQEVVRLDQVLGGAGLEIVGGTSLFRLARTHAAAELFERLGRAGILVRRFAEMPDCLRFGLPAAEAQWQRLAVTLTAT